MSKLYRAVVAAFAAALISSAAQADGSNTSAQGLVLAALKRNQEVVWLDLVSVFAAAVVLLEPTQQLRGRRAIAADRRLTEARVIREVDLIGIALRRCPNDGMPKVMVPAIRRKAIATPGVRTH